MRRLAKQTRGDTYRSNRDYQQLIEVRSQRLVPEQNGLNHIVFGLDSIQGDQESFTFGAYIAAESALEVEVAISCGEVEARRSYSVASAFTRIGLAIETRSSGRVDLEFSWKGKGSLDVWGLDAGPLCVPDGVSESQILREAGKAIVPETFYLQHAVAINADLDPVSTEITVTDGRPLDLKKCSYCGRLLPVNMDNIGSLAFHKHRAKRTLHQNECRACKKWRINDDFNPKRTVDQHHESSLITRERKYFLREPQILQEIKKRTGEGLKSQIWERFGRKCFNCKLTLELKEVQLDHTRPLAYLWPIDEHATCLCGECNNNKKDRFPVDFYSDSQLRELAKICGLSYTELVAKSVNQHQLARILEDIVTFAQEWEPRTFFSISRKVEEIHPEIKLTEILYLQSPETFEDIRRRSEAVRIDDGDALNPIL